MGPRNGDRVERRRSRGDVNTGVYGHRVSMLDFQPADLARFSEMGKIVGFEDRPPQVLTALSISGSAAQSKTDAFPADCDFFERINIVADTRKEACTVLADMIRDKALATANGLGHRLWEVKFGQHPVEATKGGADRVEDMPGVQDAALSAVNTYFERALRSVPEIDAYLQEIVTRAP